MQNRKSIDHVSFTLKDTSFKLYYIKRTISFTHYHQHTNKYLKNHNNTWGAGGVKRDGLGKIRGYITLLNQDRQVQRYMGVCMCCICLFVAVVCVWWLRAQRKR